MTGRRYATWQPKHGDGCLCCRHIDPPRLFGIGPWHWFRLRRDGGAIPCQRSDGSRLMVSWLIVCDQCYARSLSSGGVQDRPEDYAAHYMVWDEQVWGRDPIIEAPDTV